MKRYFLFGIIIILIAGFLYNPSAQTSKSVDKEELKEEILLFQAVEVGGFQIEEFNINISTFIPNTFLTIEEIESKQKDIMEILNVSKEAIIINMDSSNDFYDQNYFEDLPDTEEAILEQRVEDDQYNEIIRFLPSKDGNMTVIKLLSNHIEGKDETYIMVDIVQNKGYKEIVDTSDQIQNLLEKNENKVEMTINLMGAQQGKLSKSDEKERQKNIFNLLKAKKIEVLEDELFTSITGYSPLISQYINYDEKNVNIQLAMRYSEYEDKTYLWLARPLITTSY